MLESVVWLVHLLAAASVIGLVLLQHGKGADVGAAFGSGSAGSLFGSSGAANFLSRTTAVAATVFFLTSLLLTWFSGHHVHGSSLMQKPGVLTDAPAIPGQLAPSQIPAPPAGVVGKPVELPASATVPVPVPVPAPAAAAPAPTPAGSAK